VRCFIAIEMNEAVQELAIAAQQRLREYGAGIRWVRPEQIHITLKFLGEVPDQKVVRVAGAMAAVAEATPPFRIEVGGIGCFPPRGWVRVVWIGLRDPSGELGRCFDRCEAQMSRLGFAREGRGFSPHITIGRVRKGSNLAALRSAIETIDLPGTCSFEVDELVLFQSVLGPKGPTYTALSRAKMGG